MREEELRRLFKSMMRKVGYIEMYMKRKQWDLADDRAVQLLNMVLKLRAEIRIRSNIYSVPANELIKEVK